MMQFSKFILISTLSLQFIACSHMVFLPGSFQQQPVVAGRLGGGEVKLAAESTLAIDIFDDITSNPPDRDAETNESLISAALLLIPAMDVSVGLFPYIDVYYTGAAGVRWMFWGQPDKDGWRSTVFTGVVGRTDSSSKDTAAGHFEADTDSTGMEYGFSVGYAFNRGNLLYLTVGRQDGKAKTDITQPTQTFAYSDKFEHSIATLGWSVGETWYFNSEMGTTHTKWKFDEGGSDTFEDVAWSFGVGYRW